MRKKNEESALNNAIASAEIDGAEFTGEMLDLLRKSAKNEISQEEFLVEALAIANKH